MSLINRFKTALSALLGITLLAAVPAITPARAAGTLPLAMAQQIDVNGQPLAGCLVNFFVAGTVATPQNSYSDFGLTQNPNNVLTCDQTGRVPMFWLADGLIHVRMTDASGVPIIDTTMQVLGPSSGGGGGGGTVDPTTIFATGDMKAKYGTGVLSGFVRLNGLTIGNATCGCSERSNADTQTLWVYLYTTDPNLAVSGGRTGNALNDYNANKQLTLPDWRGRALAFLDDMGNSPAGRLAGSMVPNGTTLGAAGGAESLTLLLANLPPYTPTGSVSTSVTGTASVTSTNWVANHPSDSTPQSVSGAGSAGITITCCSGVVTKLASAGAISANGTSSFSGVAQGGVSQPINKVMPAALATVYIKL